MMSIHGASEFEQAAIVHILKKEAPEYIKHLQYLSVDKREYTGAGFYIYLKYSSPPPLISSESKTMGQSVYADIEGLEGGAGFVLYIDEGQITMLECFSHISEPWPSQISVFEINDL